MEILLAHLLLSQAGKLGADGIVEFFPALVILLWFVSEVDDALIVFGRKARRRQCLWSNPVSLPLCFQLGQGEEAVEVSVEFKVRWLILLRSEFQV